MMRQAGRYLPEYRQSRAKVKDFMALCRNAELCCEVTLQPLDRFPLDAAILFSDILTIPDAMGLGLKFVEGEGPIFDKPLHDAISIHALGIPDPEQDLGYVMKAVRTIKAALNGRVPLIGFSGSPWTLATYMVEGQGGSEFHRIKGLAYGEPELLDKLLDTLVQSVSQYLLAQAAAGADALMVFDTWGGVLSTDGYQRFSLNPMTRIVHNLKAIHPEIPVILFTKGAGMRLADMAGSGADALGVDWTVSLEQACQLTQGKVALQGNFDPLCLLSNPARIQAEVKVIMDSYAAGNGGSHTGHIFNLGHGILPPTPPEHAAVMIEAVVNRGRG
jgi:uroporphyrinogen decarboxylase